MNIASQSISSRRSLVSENILKESHERHMRELFSSLLSTTPPPPPPTSTSFSTSKINKNINGENFVRNNNLLIDLESEKTLFLINGSGKTSLSDTIENMNSMAAIEERERSASSSTLSLVSKKLLQTLFFLINRSYELIYSSQIWSTMGHFSLHYFIIVSNYRFRSI